MIDFLSLMYDLYNYYIFMFVFFVCAVVSYYKKKQTLVNTTIEKAMLLFVTPQADFITKKTLWMSLQKFIALLKGSCPRQV